MRKSVIVLLVCFSLAVGASAFAQTIAPCPNPVKIQSGTVKDVQGSTITVGFDKYGYNYQAHMFNGLYENNTRPDVVVTDGTENLIMKWSDNWLANVSCDELGLLARGYDAKTKTFSPDPDGFGPGRGTSMGWLTNHFEGDYVGSSDGELHHYTYFVKIVYDGGVACAAVLPTCIWGEYEIVEELQNDLFGGYGGRMKFVNKATGPGLGR